MSKPAWVRTFYICPPSIGLKWSAWDSRLGADSSPIGHGPTEKDAVANLLDQMREAIAERAETGLEGHFWAFDPERGPEDHIRGTGETPEAAIADLAARILEADG